VQTPLKYLLQLRLLIIGAQAAGLAWTGARFHLPVPWPIVLPVCAAMAGYTAWTWRRLRAGLVPGTAELVRQCAADMTALAVLIYFSGGAVNPFISLFLLPIVFAAATLPMRASLGIAVAAIACYTLLMFFNVPITGHRAHSHGVDLHLWGMWYGFVLSAVCIAYFVARIARALREHDLALARAREEALEAERVVALGTLAAGTAHELGTPLATMAILAKDLETDLAGEPGLRESVTLLREQIRRCKESLARLAADAGELPADSGRSIAVDDFLDGLLDDWRTQLAGIEGLEVAVEVDGPRPAPNIVVDRTLEQALSNVLNNASDASTHRVEVRAAWDRQTMWLDIRDDGPGIADKLRGQVGRRPLSTKGGRGLGIGLYLAHKVLARLGGHVDFGTPAGGGTEVRVEIPLSTLGAGVR
jgi:two-component system sensor histidine kinase RegB